jgi:hypothetical protein
MAADPRSGKASQSGARWPILDIHFCGYIDSLMQPKQPEDNARTSGVVIVRQFECEGPELDLEKLSWTVSFSLPVIGRGNGPCRLSCW